MTHAQIDLLLSGVSSIFLMSIPPLAHGGSPQGVKKANLNPFSHCEFLLKLTNAIQSQIKYYPTCNNIYIYL